MLVVMSAAAAMLADPEGPSEPQERTAASTGTQAPYGPAVPVPVPKRAAKPGAGNDGCQDSSPSPQSREIIVCAIKPEGYRLNPDVVEAKRQLRSGGSPVRPGQLPSGNNCATVGPMGCRGVPAINLLAAAITAGKIADRLSKGEEIGSIFVTDPHPSEYQLYLEAKKVREEKEAEKRAAADKIKSKDKDRQPIPNPPANATSSAKESQ